MKNKYVINGDTTVLHVNCKGEVLEYVIDTSDLELVDSFPHTWQSVLGYAVGFTNRKKGQKQKPVRLHRLIMSCPENMVVDHIDGNKLNNKRNNLRVVTLDQNRQNIKINKKTKSGVKNVYWDHRKNVWYVSLKINNKAHYIGAYKDIEEAKLVATHARAKLMPYSFEKATNIDVSSVVKEIQEHYKTKAYSHNKSSGVKGVCWSKFFNKWKASIQKNGKRKCSYHDDLESAIQARKQMENGAA